MSIYIYIGRFNKYVDVCRKIRFFDGLRIETDLLSRIERHNSGVTRNMHEDKVQKKIVAQLRLVESPNGINCHPSNLNLILVNDSEKLLAS